MKKMLYALMIVVIMAGVFVPTAAAEEETTISVIITAAGDVEAVIAEVEALDGTVTHVYENFPMLVADVTPEAAVTLSGLTIVESVAKNHLRTVGPPPPGREGDASPTSYVLGEGVDVEAVTDLSAEPEGYYNYGAVGAPGIWFAPGGNIGQTSIIAVVDTGIAPNICLGGRVMPGFNATGDGQSPTWIGNIYHGTFVAQMAGAACKMFNVPAGDSLVQALLEHNPGALVDNGDGTYDIMILGVAPGAVFYPVKVFPYYSGSTSDSVVIAGLDHILGRKLLPLGHPGHLDTDIVNMSLGGPTYFDGWDAYRRPIADLTAAGILIVTSAGNSGPVPNSIGSPATDFHSLAVGATDDAIPTRIFYDYFMGPGWGYSLRPVDDIRITNFSSRGPLSDGRAGPDVVAQGQYDFAYANVGGSFGWYWSSGTSFSSPIVAGGAALLNTWWEQNHPHPLFRDRPGKIRNAILLGADPDKISDAFQARDFGLGYLDIPAAWSLLKNTYVSNLFWPLLDHKLYNNIGWDCDDTACVYESDVETVGPGETFDLVFEVHPEIIDEIVIELLDVDAPPGNSANLWVKSAKRSDTPYVIDDLYAYSGDAQVSIRDDEVNWVCDDCYVIGGNFDWPMEPGQWKVTVAGYGDWFFPNNAPVSFKLRITKPFRWDPPGEPWKQRPIWTGKTYTFHYTVPPGGLDKLTFDLAWGRDWSTYPTSDLDMVVKGPLGPGAVYYYDGATMNAPERVIIEDPDPGVYEIKVLGYEVNSWFFPFPTDFFKLYVTAE
jgi:hypothetical protein